MRSTKARGCSGRKKIPAFRRLGFYAYGDYLGSDLWEGIRLEKLERDPKCECCGGSATQVHHYSYSYETMAGLNIRHLVSLCRECHLDIEFTGGAKNSLAKAQEKLIHILVSSGKIDRANQILGREPKASKKPTRKRRGGDKPKSKRYKENIPQRTLSPCSRCSKNGVLVNKFCQECIAVGVCYIPRPQYS